MHNDCLEVYTSQHMFHLIHVLYTENIYCRRDGDVSIPYALRKVNNRYETLSSAAGPSQDFPAWPAQIALVGPGQRVPTYNSFIGSSNFVHGVTTV